MQRLNEQLICGSERHVAKPGWEQTLGLACVGFVKPPKSSMVDRQKQKMH